MKQRQKQPLPDRKQGAYNNLMKRSLLLLSYLLISFYTFSQVKSVVVDSNTNKPINMVAVAVQGKAVGTYTDELGRFMLVDIGNKDSILFKHIGYDKKILGSTDWGDTIRLNPRSNYLKEVMVSPAKLLEIKSRARNKSSNISFAAFSGFEIAQLITVEANNEFVKTVMVYIKRVKTNASTHLRLHLYANNKGEPGAEILLNGGRVTAHNVGNCISFNLASESVLMPPEGIFVGIEWINQIANRGQQLEPRVLVSKSKKQDQNTYYRFWDQAWESLNTLLQMERANTVFELTTIVFK